MSDERHAVRAWLLVTVSGREYYWKGTENDLVTRLVRGGVLEVTMPARAKQPERAVTLVTDQVEYYRAA